jgi:hypothetical protein
MHKHQPVVSAPNRALSAPPAGNNAAATYAAAGVAPIAGATATARAAAVAGAPAAATAAGGAGTVAGAGAGAGAGAATAVAGAGAEEVRVREARLWELFPSGQVGPAHRAREGQAVWWVAEPGCRFARRVHEALSQLLHQTARRQKHLAIEDDEFFHADKVQRVEQARKYWRDGARLFQPLPNRKKPLSSLLRQSFLPGDRRYVLTPDQHQPEPPAPTTAAPPATSHPAPAAGPQAAGPQAGPAVRPGVSAGVTAGVGAVSSVFPGSVPVSMMRSDIKKLYDGAYFFVWAPKTNGLRFFAVFCHLGGYPWVLLVNRAQDIFVLPGIVAPDVMFDGTVLDGELVPTNNGSFAFVAYDCASSCGVPCSEYNYLVRLQIAGLLADSWNTANGRRGEANQQPTAQSTAMDVGPPKTLSAGMGGGLGALEWRVKRVYSPERVMEMLLEQGSLDHGTDGYITTAVEPPIQIGQTQTIFKVKRATDHTIDFLAVVLNATEPNPAVVLVDLVAMSNNGSHGVLFDTIEISGAELPLVARRLGYQGAEPLLNIDEWLNGRVVECRYNPARQSWDPELMRSDKSTPNKIYTAQKTWQNIEEDLRLTDIFPPGSIPDNTRAQLVDWEKQHPDWKIHPEAKSNLAKTNRRDAETDPPSTTDDLATRLEGLRISGASAPVPLNRLISFG